MGLLHVAVARGRPGAQAEQHAPRRRVGRRLVCPVEQLRRARRLSGQPGGVGSRDQSLGAAAARGGKLGRPLVRRGRGRASAALPRALAPPRPGSWRSLRRRPERRRPGATRTCPLLPEPGARPRAGDASCAAAASWRRRTGLIWPADGRRPAGRRRSGQALSFRPPRSAASGPFEPGGAHQQVQLAAGFCGRDQEKVPGGGRESRRRERGTNARAVHRAAVSGEAAAGRRSGPG